MWISRSVESHEYYWIWDRNGKGTFTKVFPIWKEELICMFNRKILEQLEAVKTTVTEVKVCLED